MSRGVWYMEKDDEFIYDPEETKGPLKGHVNTNLEATGVSVQSSTSEYWVGVGLPFVVPTA